MAPRVVWQYRACIGLDVRCAFCSSGGSRPKLQALTVSQIEARVEDPTIALKKLLKENK